MSSQVRTTLHRFLSSASQHNIIRAGSNLLERWESKVAINYALFSLLKTFLALILMTHWFACFLGTIHSWQIQATGRLPCDRDANVLSSENDCTWLETYAGRQTVERLSSMDNYILCVYWGVGEIMSLNTGASVRPSVRPSVSSVSSHPARLACPCRPSAHPSIRRLVCVVRLVRLVHPSCPSISSINLVHPPACPPVSSVYLSICASICLSVGSPISGTLSQVKSCHGTRSSTCGSQSCTSLQVSFFAVAYMHATRLPVQVF